MFGTSDMSDRRAGAVSGSDVVVVGPPLDIVGGMTSVVRQTLDFDYDGRYRVHHVPTTHGREDEGRASKLLRHGRHLRHLRRTIRRVGAEIVHVHTCSGFSFFRSALDLVAAQRLGCRVILHVHGAAFDAFFAGSTRAGRCCISWALRRADCVIALSESWRIKLATMASRADIRVIENAVAIPASPVTTEPGSPGGPCHFVVLARMDAWKGIDDALAAAVILAERGESFRLTLAGPEGSAGDRHTLGERIRLMGLADAVRYVGPVVGKAKTDLLRGADVYLMPSHHEGMPLAVLEAMAEGLPVVGTRVGAVPELVGEDCGRLVPARSPERLAKAMAAYIDDEDTRRQAGRAAAALVRRRFGVARLRRDLLALYDALVAARKARGAVRQPLRARRSVRAC
jgi:glycosyltransferase involved in cell wall biosynthesis